MQIEGKNTYEVPQMEVIIFSEIDIRTDNENIRGGSTEPFNPDLTTQ